MKKKATCIILLLILITSGCVTNTDAPNTIIDELDTAQLITSQPTEFIPQETPSPDTHLPIESSLPTPPPSAEPTTIEPPPPTTPFIPSAYAAKSIEIAEDFLIQYVSMFCGVFSHGPRFGCIYNEPFITVNERAIYDSYGRRHHWELYFTDLYGDVIDVEDVPFIKNLYVTIADDLTIPAPVAAGAFQIYTTEGSDTPLLIIIRFDCFRFTEGVYFIFQRFNDGASFTQLGSRIGWATGGGDIPILSPFINESGEVIFYIFFLGDGFLHLLNNESEFDTFWMFDMYDFRPPVLADDFSQMLIDFEVNQNATTQSRDLLTDLYYRNFVPMVRMYELEDYLIEKITQQLRGMFPVVDVNQIDE